MSETDYLIIAVFAAPVFVLIGTRLIEWMFPAVDRMEIKPPVYDSDTDTEWNCTDE